MNGRNSATLLFIILILKFNNQVKTTLHTCGNTLQAKCNLTFVGNTNPAPKVFVIKGNGAEMIIYEQKSGNGNE